MFSSIDANENSGITNHKNNFFYPTSFSIVVVSLAFLLYI